MTSPCELFIARLRSRPYVASPPLGQHGGPLSGQPGDPGPAFRTIHAEILRQYAVVQDLLRATDHKAGLVVGFGFLLLGLVVGPQSAGPHRLDIPQDLIASAGVAAVLLSGYYGIRALYSLKLKVGPDARRLVALFRSGRVHDLDLRVSREVLAAYEANRGVVRTKVRNLRRAIVLLFIGTIALIAVRAGPMVTLP